MAELLRAACVQFCAGPDIEKNMQAAGDLIRRAAAQGARLITTPENTCHIRVPSLGKLESAFSEAEHPMLPFFSNLARESNAFLLIGSLSIKLPKEKLANRSYLLAPSGERVVTYDKIHLFDVDLPSGEKHRESDLFKPGTSAPVVPVDDFHLGLTICYDMRFPTLYQDLAQAGANVLAVPSAFTVATGQAHWHTLLRARAIENGAYVLAPAQCGIHEGGRQTYGHSLIVGPWGEIVAERREDTPGIVMADLDLAQVDKARRAIPVLQHRRKYKIQGAAS